MQNPVFRSHVPECRGESGNQGNLYGQPRCDQGTDPIARNKILQVEKEAPINQVLRFLGLMSEDTVTRLNIEECVVMDRRSLYFVLFACLCIGGVILGVIEYANGFQNGQSAACSWWKSYTSAVLLWLITPKCISKRQKFPKPLSIELAGNADVAIGDFSALGYTVKVQESI
jgi:hypothetical protein